ncbi:hypothetical protein MCERH10_00264 [Caulobacteraceae bacterium]
MRATKRDKQREEREAFKNRVRQYRETLEMDTPEVVARTTENTVGVYHTIERHWKGWPTSGRAFDLITGLTPDEQRIVRGYPIGKKLRRFRSLVEELQTIDQREQQGEFSKQQSDRGRQIMAIIWHELTGFGPEALVQNLLAKARSNAAKAHGDTARKNNAERSAWKAALHAALDAYFQKRSAASLVRPATEMVRPMYQAMVDSGYPDTRRKELPPPQVENGTLRDPVAEAKHAQSLQTGEVSYNQFYNYIRDYMNKNGIRSTRSYKREAF